MILTFLGTSAGKPSAHRNVTSLWLNLQDEIGENWLIDCGEGTQHQMISFSVQHQDKIQNKKDRVHPYHLDRIFITHLHGDHVLGLFGVLIARSMSGQDKPLYLTGPFGIKALVEQVLDATQSKLGYSVTFLELDEMQQGDAPLTILEETLKRTQLKVETLSLRHRLPCFGYRINFKSSPNTTKSIVVFGDSMPCENIIRLAKNADYMIYEATYMQDLAHLGEQRMHSTTTQVAELAKEAKCKHLIVTHLSGRYNGEELAPFQAEISAIFPNNQVAFDFMQVTI